MRVDRLHAGEGERLRRIRLRALADAPDAFGTTLDEAAARPHESWEFQIRELATFVAATPEADVGLARGGRHDHLADAGYLLSMWVAPGARQRGVGRALADAVVAWAREEGLRRLFLDVGESNEAAIALYERAGFERNGIAGSLPPPRKHMREIQMVKPL